MVRKASLVLGFVLPVGNGFISPVPGLCGVDRASRAPRPQDGEGSAWATAPDVLFPGNSQTRAPSPPPSRRASIETFGRASAVAPLSGQLRSGEEASSPQLPREDLAKFRAALKTAERGDHQAIDSALDALGLDLAPGGHHGPSPHIGVIEALEHGVLDIESAVLLLDRLHPNERVSTLAALSPSTRSNICGKARLNHDQHELNGLIDWEGLLFRRGYCSQLAAAMGILSRRCYRRPAPENDVLERLRGLGFEIHETDAAASFPFFVAHRDDVAVFAFRGTEVTSIANILCDLDMLPRPSLGGKVHSGVDKAAEKLWPEIDALITHMKARSDRPLRLYFTGHSLGGALAVVTAVRASSREDTRVEGVYTFGMPKFLDKRAAEVVDATLGDSLHRVSNVGDSISEMPLTRIPWPYHHVGQPVLLDRLGYLHHLSPKEMESRHDSHFRHASQSPHELAGLGAHNIGRYGIKLMLTRGHAHEDAGSRGAVRESTRPE